MAGHWVRYVLAAKLVNELDEIADDKNSPRPSPDAAASTNSATWNSTNAAPNCLFLVLTEREEEAHPQPDHRPTRDNRSVRPVGGPESA